MDRRDGNVELPTTRRLGLAFPQRSLAIHTGRSFQSVFLAEPADDYQDEDGRDKVKKNILVSRKDAVRGQVQVLLACCHLEHASVHYKTPAFFITMTRSSV